MIWTKSPAAGKATVRYMLHRPDREGHRGYRDLWGADGGMEKVDAYALLDAAPRGATVYKVVVAPSADEDRQRDLDLQELARQTMEEIERRVGQPVRWAASVHDNHSDHRHVHAVAVLPRRLDKPDLVAVKEATTLEAHLQRAIRDQGRTHAAAYERAGAQSWTQELSL